MDVKTLTYIQSESEFNKAKKQGLWDVVLSMFTRHDAFLLSFNETVSKYCTVSAMDLGLQDVCLKDIVGSVGRPKGFTRHFLPYSGAGHDKERWRTIYMLATTGAGFPPIEVYKIGSSYFVEDGHHRVSVARHLGWATIQAYVTELPVNNC